MENLRPYSVIQCDFFLISIKQTSHKKRATEGVGEEYNQLWTIETLPLVQWTS